MPMTITTTPIDATLGAVVTDVSLNSLDDDTWQDIHKAFLEYAVLVFPAQHLTDEEQGTFALRFGNIEKLGPRQKAGVAPISNHIYGFHDKGAPLRPVIKTHAETGRKSLYTGRHAYEIPGMDPDESETLLASLLEEACQSPRVYRHPWNVGDVVVWDNRCVMHCACPYDTRHPRVLRGSRIAGDSETELAPTFEDERAEAFHPTSSNGSRLVHQ